MNRIVEGKTKIVTPINHAIVARDPQFAHCPDDWNLISRMPVVEITTKDVLTANNGELQADFPGIGIEKTRQAWNTVSLLSSMGVPTAKWGEEPPDGTNIMYAKACDMLPLEIIMRSRPFGSYNKRHPEDAAQIDDRGRPLRFQYPTFELFYKDTVAVDEAGNANLIPENKIQVYYTKRDENRYVEKHTGIRVTLHSDPIVIINEKTGKWDLYPQKQLAAAYAKTGPIYSINPTVSPEELSYIKNKIIVPAFRILEAAWAMTPYMNEDGRAQKIALADIKFEVGRTKEDGELVLADVIDNDSWRIWRDGDPKQELDKQAFRDGKPDPEVTDKYRKVTQLSENFKNPNVIEFIRKMLDDTSLRLPPFVDDKIYLER
ncbi:MAG: hypothetical protein LBO78_00175 [Rickettsiales bacterium]|jgi:phosphoribosylaminoimidazole-succinocarboxamide synthase|nr:hypothetical protein [Rickettsiales bacterium]